MYRLGNPRSTENCSRVHSHLARSMQGPSQGSIHNCALHLGSVPVNMGHDAALCPATSNRPQSHYLREHARASAQPHNCRCYQLVCHNWRHKSIRFRRQRTNQWLWIWPRHRRRTPPFGAQSLHLGSMEASARNRHFRNDCHPRQPGPPNTPPKTRQPLFTRYRHQLQGLLV